MSVQIDWDARLGRHSAIPQRARAAFFVGMSSVLLLLVLAGFARSFYLRAFFEVRPMASGWVWAHGIVLTGWFIAFFLQTALIAARRTDIHRRLGWSIGALGVGALATSTVITWDAASVLVFRLPAAGFDAERVMFLAPRIIFSNFATVVAFSVLLATAIALRRRVEAHKRLMLLASISMIQPAIVRIFPWAIFGDFINANAFLFAVGASFVLVAVLALYDLATRRQVHPATLIGGACFIGVKLLGIFVIANSEVGRSFVRGLA